MDIAKEVGSICCQIELKGWKYVHIDELCLWVRWGVKSRSSVAPLDLNILRFHLSGPGSPRSTVVVDGGQQQAPFGPAIVRV